jgi:hypothetical protein
MRYSVQQRSRLPAYFELSGEIRVPSGLILSRSIQLWLAVTPGGALVVWQLFLPPIIGLADQGDFLRLLGPLGYAPVPKGPEHKYWYVTRKYVKDPSYRQPRFEQVTSEFIPARTAIDQTCRRFWKRS